MARTNAELAADLRVLADNLPNTPSVGVLLREAAERLESRAVVPDLTDDQIKDEAWRQSPLHTSEHEWPGSPILRRIARTKFCREYDTFTSYCNGPNCCGEAGHDNSCDLCDDHKVLAAISRGESK
jgi:hypothetical protein